MDFATERERILRRDAEWSEVTSQGRDVERIVSYWTDDAIVLAPNLPAIIGKAALRKYVADSLKIPGFKISWTANDVTMSPDGQLAYMFARNTVTMNEPNGTPVTHEGRAVTIWRRESDGEWRCAVDIWNAEPPLA